MMKQKNSKIIFALIGMMSITSFVSAGGQSSSASGGTVDVLPLHSFSAGNYDKTKWYQSWLKDNLGIELRLREFTSDAERSQIFQNQMVSRQMSDVIAYNDRVGLVRAREAGLLINLDDHKDKLPALYNNPVYANMIKYSRKNYSPNGQGLYILPMFVGKSNNVNFTPSIRWDLYEKLGSPKLAGIDDLIPLLKKMMELEPVSETGRKTYGIILFPEWDVFMMNFASYMRVLYGGRGAYLTEFFIETTGTGYTGAVRSILDDNSDYKQGLNWYFKANQAGIIDPDSLNENFASVTQKYTDGNIFFSWFTWMCSGYNTEERVSAASPRGFMPILADDMTAVVEPDNPVGEVGRAMALGATNPKNLDAALKYLNHFLSWEGMTMLYADPEGIIWEKGSDGVARIKASAWQYVDGTTTTGIPELGGSLYGQANSIMNFTGVNFGEVSPITGKTMLIGDWPDVIAHNNESNVLFKKWSAANNGALNIFDLITKTGKIAKVNPAVSFMPIMPQDIETLRSQIGDVIKTNSWKMVFAANQAEFDALWKDMQQKAEILGMQKIVDWSRNAWAAAQAEVADYL
jgi:hypothetical protein